VIIREEHHVNSASGFPERQRARLAFILVLLSLTAVVFYHAKQELLLYGDAVAHVNIARRVVDNRHPLESFGQLGTVWLPLQHMAMLPFVWNESLWRSGIAGAIPSMFAYVLGALGIFRLVNGRAPKIVAYMAMGIYALNPNLLYMQSTAMNEPIFLAFFTWTLVYLDDFLRDCFANLNVPIRPARGSPTIALEACGITLAAGAFTRYDGWFVGATVGAVVICAVAVWWRRTTDIRQQCAMAKSLIEFLLLNALVPVFWLIYNNRVSGRALDFLNGPYSAKVITIRTTPHGAPPYPGQDHIFTAGLYFLESAKLNMGPSFWGYLLFMTALAGTGIAVWRFRRYGIFLLLWLPLPFYALSIAYGSVPIFMPVWYPHSYYNVRYGLELLPVFAVFIALAAAVIFERASGAGFKAAGPYVLVGAVAAAYLSAYREKPITLREAQVSSRDRVPMERALGVYLAALPRPTTLLMYESDHVGALQQAGIPLRRVISEWAHPDWERALISPPGDADYVIACDGDPVSIALRQDHVELPELLSFGTPGQSHCTIYKATMGASAQDFGASVGSERENRR
jgi:4-amino-4-deoxy-L-arabinose transferase-like glycosyltransferase